MQHLEVSYFDTDSTTRFHAFRANTAELVRITGDGSMSVSEPMHPTAKLDVRGTLNVSGITTITNDLELTRGSSAASLTRKLVIGGARNNGSDFATLQFKNYDSNHGAVDYVAAEIKGSVPTAANNGGELVFLTAADGATSQTERVRITSAGDVGIGTNAPTAKLDVRGTLNVSGVSTFITSDTVNQPWPTSSGDGTAIRIKSTLLSSYDSTGNGGVTSADASKHLQGAFPANVSIANTLGTAGINFSDGDIQREVVGLTQYSGSFAIFTRNTTYDAADNYIWASPLNGIQVGYSTAGASLANGFVIKKTKVDGNGTSTEIFKIESSTDNLIFSGNNVGIGSASPTAKLDVNGTLNVSGISTFQDDVFLGDSDKIILGDGGDLEIFHNGTDSVIKDTSTNLIYRSFQHSIKNQNGLENLAVFTTNSSVELYHANSKKFETSGIGVSVSGIVTAISGIVTYYGDGQYLDLTNSVSLGGDTTGDYVESVSGTANEIEVTGGTGEGSTPTIGFVANPTIGGNVNIGQDLTVTRDLQVTRNLNVDGTVTIGGTSATIFAESLKVSDPDLILGIRTDAGGNDISNDTTANHGGIAIASTEGSPLITLVNPGAGETLPSTYKKIMWFKTNSFTGLNTDAWLSNYAFGVGTTSMSSGTKFAVGNIEANFDDFTSVRNINSSGIVTADSYYFTSGNYFTSQPTGEFGSVQINGNGKGGWEGYSIDGHAVFMAQTSTGVFGLYDDTNNHWVLRHSRNGDDSHTQIRGGNNSINLSVYGTDVRVLNVPLIVNRTTLTGTASQNLQVDGGAYISGDVGIGITNPTYKLHIETTNADGIFIDDTNTSSDAPHIRVRAKRSDNNGSQAFSGQLILEKNQTNSPTTNNRHLGTIIFGGNYHASPGITTGMTYGASMGAISEGDFSDINTAPTALVFHTGTVGLGTLGTANTTFGDTESLRINSSNNVLIGSASDTGTASQKLQVTGGGYVSGNLGVGDTNPQDKLRVYGGTTWLDNTSGDTLSRAQGLTVSNVPNANWTPGTDPSDNKRNTTFASKGSTRPVIVAWRNIDDSNAFWDFIADANTDKFYIQQGGAYQPTFTWDTNQQVAIGTDVQSGSTLAVGGTITELYSGQYWNVVSQADIGSDPDQIPLNQYLGELAFLDDHHPNGLRRDGGGSDDVFVNSSGDVGIGTDNPTYKLHVNDTESSGAGLLVQGGGGGGPIAKFERTVGSTGTINIHASGGDPQISFGANNTFSLGTNGSNFEICDASAVGTDQRLVINTSGNIGIGTDNPTEKLDVIGTVKATDFNTTSDQNLKTNIQTIEDPLEKIVQIRGVNFEWKENNKPSAGVIAQEVEKVLPQLVNGEDTKTVNYNGLIGLLVEAVKAQQEEINELKRRIG